MKNLVRDAPFGQLIRYLTANRFFKYPEEEPDFQCPTSYTRSQTPSSHSSRPSSGEFANKGKQEESQGSSTVQVNESDIEKIAEGPITSQKVKTRPLPYTGDGSHQDAELALEKAESRPIAPVKTGDGTILVDWYSTDDPDNPQVSLIGTSIKYALTDGMIRTGPRRRNSGPRSLWTCTPSWCTVPAVSTFPVRL